MTEPIKNDRASVSRQAVRHVVTARRQSAYICQALSGDLNLLVKLAKLNVKLYYADLPCGLKKPIPLTGRPFLECMEQQLAVARRMPYAVPQHSDLEGANHWGVAAMNPRGTQFAFHGTAAW